MDILNFEESCGFGKWSISFNDEDCCVVIRFNRWPNTGEIKLYDVTGDDLNKLSKMFAAANYNKK